MFDLRTLAGAHLRHGNCGIGSLRWQAASALRRLVIFSTRSRPLPRRPSTLEEVMMDDDYDAAESALSNAWVFYTYLSF